MRECRRTDGEPQVPGPEGGADGAPAFVVGADGGGTGSRALVMDVKGSGLGRAQGPPALVDPSNPEAAAEAIALTVRAALAQAGLHPPARGLWTGLAGAGREGTREAVEIALRSRGLALETRVGMDVEGAHFDAFGSDPGVLLSVGTGSVVWARDPGGREMKVGGWGTRLGEDGSGYWFGMEGLRALARAHDGRDPPTSLTPALLGALGLSSFWDLIPWVAHASKAEIGALAPLVLEAAAAGDPTSRGILDAGLDALGKHLNVVRAAWMPWGGLFPLALSGGLLEEGGLLRPVAMEMAAKWGAELRTDPVIPARGAARLALLLVPPA